MSDSVSSLISSGFTTLISSGFTILISSGFTTAFQQMRQISSRSQMSDSLQMMLKNSDDENLFLIKLFFSRQAILR